MVLVMLVEKLQISLLNQENEIKTGKWKKIHGKKSVKINN
jgi:hypothetical protein